MIPHTHDRETGHLSVSEQITSEELIERALRIPAIRDAVEHGTPPAIEAAPAPVVQPETRIAPQWATGIAVAGTGVGLMSVGVGLGAKLVFDSVTTEGVVMVSVIVGGVVVFAGVLARIASKVRDAVAAAPAPVTNHFHGDVQVHHHTRVHNEGRALSFQRNHITDGGH